MMQWGKHFPIAEDYHLHPSGRSCLAQETSEKLRNLWRGGVAVGQLNFLLRTLQARGKAARETAVTRMVTTTNETETNEWRPSTREKEKLSLGSFAWRVHMGPGSKRSVQG